jgi:hypothetical protein
LDWTLYVMLRHQLTWRSLLASCAATNRSPPVHSTPSTHARKDDDVESG